MESTEDRYSPGRGCTEQKTFNIYGESKYPIIIRTWELAGEAEGRWVDLLRLEKIAETNSSKMKEVKPLDLQPNSRGEYFLEIPEYDKLINENLK